MNDVGGSESGTGLRAAKSSRTSDANFENFEDSEWDIGIGNLIIDLDADIEKNNEANRTSSGGTSGGVTTGSSTSSPNNSNNNSTTTATSISSNPNNNNNNSSSNITTTNNSNLSSSTSSSSLSTSTITTATVVGSGGQQQQQQKQSSGSSSSQMHIPRIPGNSGSGPTSTVTPSSLKGSNKGSSQGGGNNTNSNNNASSTASPAVLTGNSNINSSSTTSSSSCVNILGGGVSGKGTSTPTSDLSKNLANISMEHSATVEKGLKMKIKRSKPGTKSVEAKHEIVKNDAAALSSANNNNVGGKNSSSNLTINSNIDSKASTHGGKDKQDKDNNSGNNTNNSGPNNNLNNKGIDDGSSATNANSGSGNNANDQGVGGKVKAPKRGSKDHKKVKNATNANSGGGNVNSNTNKKDVSNLVDNKSTTSSSSSASSSTSHVKHDMIFGVNVTGLSPSASAFVKTSTNASLKVPTTGNLIGQQHSSDLPLGNSTGGGVSQAFRSQHANSNSSSSTTNANNNSSIPPWSTASPSAKDGKGQGRLSPSVTTVNDKLNNTNSPSYGKKARVFATPNNNEKSQPVQEMVLCPSDNSYRTVTLSSASLTDLNPSSMIAKGGTLTQSSNVLNNFNSNSKDAQKTGTATQTSFGTVTEPDCLGPCEPGTSVTLEGIVWHETESGVLVVNVTWRGKTYVGTLLDCTKNDWAPPRFCDSPTSDLEMRNPKNRGKRGRAQQAATPVNEPSPAEVRSNNTKLRNGVKGRRGSSTNAAFATPVSPLKPDPWPKRKTRGSENESQEETTTAPKNAKRPKVSSKDNAYNAKDRQPNSPAPQNNNSLDSQQTSGPSSPALIECPEPNCSKKYKHINGLRYHQAHAHNNFTPEDSDSNMSTASTTNANNLNVDTKSESNNNTNNNNNSSNETSDATTSENNRMDVDMDVISTTDGENTSSAPTTPAKRNNNNNSTKETNDKIYDINTDADINNLSNSNNTSISGSTSSNNNKEAIDNEVVTSGGASLVIPGPLNKSMVNSASNKGLGVKLNANSSEINIKLDMDKSIPMITPGLMTTPVDTLQLKDNITPTSLSTSTTISSTLSATPVTASTTTSTIGRPPILTVPVPYISRPLVHPLSGHNGHVGISNDKSNSSPTLNRDDSLNVMKTLVTTTIPSATTNSVVSVKGAPHAPWQPHAIAHNSHSPHHPAHVISSLHPIQQSINTPLNVPVIGPKDHEKSKSNKDKSLNVGDLSLLQQQQQAKKPKHKKKSKEKEREKGGNNNSNNNKGGNNNSTKLGSGGFSGPNSNSTDNKGKDMMDRRSSSLDESDKDGKDLENPQSPAYSDISDANESGPELELNVGGGGTVNVNAVKENCVKTIITPELANKKDSVVVGIPPSHGISSFFSPAFYPYMDPNSASSNNASGNSPNNLASNKIPDNRSAGNVLPEESSLDNSTSGNSSNKKGSKQPHQQQQQQSHPHPLHGHHGMNNHPMQHVPPPPQASTDDRRSPKVDYMGFKSLPQHYFSHYPHAHPYSTNFFDQAYGQSIMSDNNSYPGSHSRTVFMDEQKERELQMSNSNESRAGPNNNTNKKGDKDDSPNILLGNIKQEPGMLDNKDNNRKEIPRPGMTPHLIDKDGHDIKSEFPDNLYGEKRTNLNLLPPQQQQPHFIACSKHSKDTKSRDDRHTNKDDTGKDSSSSGKSGRNSVESKNSKSNQNLERRDGESNDGEKDGKTDSKNEGSKPTMETQGPPPPPTAGSGYAYLPQGYLPSSPFGIPFDPSHPLYRQVLVPGPYSAPPYMHQPRYPPNPGAAIPEDLSRPGGGPPGAGSKALDLLQHHAAQYYASHKIHELQERALKSPSPQVGPNSGQNLSSTPNSPGGIAVVSERQGRGSIVGGIVGGGSPGTISSSKPADLTKDTKPIIGVGQPGDNSQGQSRSPTHHIHSHSHTHHHTHLVGGYPIIPAVPPQYSPHYGVLTPPSAIGSGVAPSVINPYPNQKPN